MEKLLCINNHCTDPYFNLATEEYLLKNRQENIFMLWQNEPAVVVGKHQNIHAEINHDFIAEKKVKVARRLSGGGTVYHDLGNLNFTYIMNGEEGKMVDFTKYTDDILQVLNLLGARAERNKRNDLILDGKKISGNAEHIFKQRVIHHGTLLFNADLETLEEAIKVQAGKYSDKAVQSVRSKVTNILPYLQAAMGLDEFRATLLNFMLNKYRNTSVYELSEEEKNEIEQLKQQKYVQWDWVYGYSPKYTLKKEFEKAGKKLIIELSIKKGVIDKVACFGDLLNEPAKEKLQYLLVGKRHDKTELKNNTVQLPNNEILTSFNFDEFVAKLF